MVWDDALGKMKVEQLIKQTNKQQIYCSPISNKLGIYWQIMIYKNWVSRHVAMEGWLQTSKIKSDILPQVKAAIRGCSQSF